MNEPIRILGIAPYENLKYLMAEVAEEFPQVELSMFVGDMEAGLAAARNNLYGNYDVVISRGGTAHILQEDLALPVIEVEISVADVLRTLRQVGELPGRAALVSLADTAGSAELLNRLLGYDIHVWHLTEPGQVVSALEQVRREQYDTVLCDVICHTSARELGMNSYLLTSGAESIRKAYVQALDICRGRALLREENLFFRQLLRGQIGQTAVFDRNGDLYFSSLEDMKPDVHEMLRRELPESRRTPERRVSRTIGKTLYSIRSRQFSDYVAFFFDSRKVPMSPNQAGIRFLSRPEAEADYYSSLFGYAGELLRTRETADAMAQTTAPIMISGEDGTGKERIAELLYLRGPMQNAPLILMNCSLLNDRSWTFLLEHHASPLTGEGNVLFFAGLDALSVERSRQLLASLSEMDVCRRNRVMFSCISHPGEFTSVTGSLFMDKLGCVSLYLPPLRRLGDGIDTLVSLALNHLNEELSTQAPGMEPEAMALLRRYAWPHNHTQFLRVLRDLTVGADGHIISQADVRQALHKEQHLSSFTPGGEDASSPLDLDRTLDEIDRDIARRVVEELDGNQTAAAKRLGISRTTLWRLLQK